MNLYEMEELERYKLGRENLASLQSNMDSQLNDKLDRIHNDFLGVYEEELGMNEIYWIKQVFSYIKQNM